MKNCTQVKLHHKEISHFNISVVSRDVHCHFKSVKHSPTSFLQPLSQPERWGKRKKWETGRKRGRKSVSKREREGEMASQTDCLAAPGSPALSVIWFWGQRLSPLMNIGAESRLPSQKKGSCFHSPGLESLFQESILPARDCKPVSRQKSYVHKYYTFFFFFFFTVL